ncbi:MAG: ferritin family protein [Nitrospinaceae bacterium]
MEISNEELLALSTKIEREASVFYQELAKHILDPEVKDFVVLMAQEEAKHEIQFKKLLEEKGSKPYGWEKNTRLRNLLDTHYQTDIFPRLEEIFEQLPKFRGIQKALAFAEEAERVSAEFYGLMQEACENIESKTLLLLLEKAEQEHLERIQSLKERYTIKPMG